MEDKKKTDLTKDELAKDFVKALGDLESIDEVENMVKDNKIEFNIKKVKYRVRLLTFEENQKLEKHRRKKYLEFINDKDMLFRKQWIKKYEAKGIDIDGMEDKIRMNLRKENEIMLKLAQTSDEKRVKELKAQIIELRKESAFVNIEKTDLLNFSIEDQLMVAVNSYYTYLVLETTSGNEKDPYDKFEWVKVYKDFEEFSKSQNSELINKAFHYTDTLIYRNGF